MRQMKIITNDNIKNFLEENGIYPVREWYEKAYYKETAQLFSLLDSYYIKFSCMPNKL